MKVAATIPIKSNSTRVKDKNFKLLGDRPLFQYIIDHCIEAGCFDSIYVDTDSDDIQKYCFNNKVKWIERKPELTLDTANGNDVFHYDIDHIDEYDFYFQLYAILTATEEYGWHWFQNQPVNYQPNILPRSQDAPPVIKETTGLYGISKRAYDRYKCRVGATPYFYIIRDRKECIDLDTQEDFDVAEQFAYNK